MSRAVAAQVQPLKQQARSESAHEIHQRLLKASVAAQSLWIHQAKAISDMRACKGWKDLGYESMAEWLTQPELNLEPANARKLAWVYETFSEAGAKDEQLAEVSPYALAVTARAVSDGDTTFDKAIADAQSIHKGELEVRYSGNLDEKLDADAEPEKWQCPTCRKIHARQPKHLREDEPEPESYAAATVAEEDGQVF